MEYRKRVNVNNLEDLNIALSNSFAAVKRDIIAIKDLQARQNSAIEKINEKIEKISEQKEKRKYLTSDDYAFLSEKIDNANKSLKKLEMDISAVSKLKEELLSLEKEEEEIKDRLSKLNDKLGEIEAIIDELSNTKDILSKLEEIKSVNTRIREVEKKSASQAYLDKQITEVTNMIASIRSEIDEIKDNLKDNYVQKKHYSKDIDEVERKLKNAYDKYENLEEMQKKQVKYYDKKLKDNSRAFVTRTDFTRTIAKASKKKGFSIEPKPSIWQMISNIAVVLSFIILLASIISYFLKYQEFVYIFLAVAIGVFIIGIIFRIIGIYKY